MKTATIGEFLTDAEIEKVTTLFNDRTSDDSFKAAIQLQIIEPNLARISKSIGQEMVASYVAWIILASCLRATGKL